MSKASSATYDGGMAYRRPRKRPGSGTRDIPLFASASERFTPPCSACHYPMLKGERECLRCGAERT